MVYLFDRVVQKTQLFCNAFFCCSWFLCLCVIIVSTKANHKATHSQRKACILLFIIIIFFPFVFEIIIKVYSSSFFNDYISFFCFFQSYSYLHVFHDEVNIYKYIHQLIILLKILIFNIFFLPIVLIEFIFQVVRFLFLFW